MSGRSAVLSEDRAVSSAPHDKEPDFNGGSADVEDPPRVPLDSRRLPARPGNGTCQILM